MGKFIVASLLVLAVAGVALVGCSSSDDSSTSGPAMTVSLGKTTSESLAGGGTQTYAFTAKSSDQYSVQMSDVSAGDAFDNIAVEWNAGVIFCLSSGDYKSCTLGSATPSAVNEFSISNKTSGTLTFKLLVEEVKN